MAASVPTLYRNAHIVDPSQSIDGPGEILVKNGVIVTVGQPGKGIKPPNRTEIVDCKGHHLFPGLVDARVFIGQPGAEYRETIASASKAAAAGGVTSLIMMPDTNPVIDDVALVEFVNRTARDEAAINIYPAAALTKNLDHRELAELGLLHEAGAVTFSTGRNSIKSSLMMRRALTYANDFGATVMATCKDADLAADGVMNEGLTATRLGLEGIPKEAEIIPLERDLRLVALTNGNYHAATISTAESAELIKTAKARGLKVTASVSINHLSLNENDIGPYRTFYRLSPPLRSEEDRTAMVEALRSGIIDVVVSNHDPQDVDTKRFPFAEAADGAIGLETLLPAALRLHHNGEVPLTRLIEALCCNPAKIFNLPCGSLSAGSPADFTIVDIDTPWVLKERDIQSRSKNTPFEGARFQGQVLQTFVGGRKVFDRPESTGN